MDQMNMPARAAVDANGYIIINAACRRCTYDVRGLNYTECCPMCGALVGPSVSGDLLRFASPQWIEKLATGTRYLSWSILVGLLFDIFIAVVFFVPSFRAIMTSGNLRLASVLNLIAGGMAFYGAWLLTAADSNGPDEGKSKTVRMVVRVAQLVSLLSAFIYPILPYIATIIAEFAKLIYLETLANRIPNPPLANRASVLRWTLAISVAAIIATAVFVLFGSCASLLIIWVLLLFLPGVAILWLVFRVITFILLYQMGQALREQLPLAR